MTVGNGGSGMERRRGIRTCIKGCDSEQAVCVCILCVCVGAAACSGENQTNRISEVTL